MANQQIITHSTKTSYSLEQKPLTEKIDWANRHVTKNPEWYNTRQISRILAPIFGSLSVAFAGLAVGCLFVPLPPMVTIPAGVTFGVVSLVLAAASIYLLTRDHWEDPVVLREKGQKAEAEIHKLNLSYPQILRKYDARIWDTDFKVADMNTFFVKDAQKMDFGDFLDKHGDDAVRILNEQNSQALRPSFEQWILKQNLGKEEFKRAYPGTAKTFLLGDSLERNLVLQQLDGWLNNKVDYRTFLANNGSDFARTLSKQDLVNREQDVISAVQRERPGYNVFKQSYTPLSDKLEWTEAKIAEVVVVPELQSFLDNSSQTYLAFRKRNSPMMFEHLPNDIKQTFQNDRRPRIEFLNQSYTTMMATDNESKSERIFLKIKKDDLARFVRMDLQQKDFTVFYQTHGMAPFKDKIFEDIDLEIGREKLNKHLDTHTTYSEVKKYWEVALALGITQQKLQQRFANDFKKLSFAQLASKHPAALFFDKDLMTQTFNQQWRKAFAQYVNGKESLSQLKSDGYINAFPRDDFPKWYEELFKKHVRTAWEPVFVNQTDHVLSHFENKNRVPATIQTLMKQTKQRFTEIESTYNDGVKRVNQSLSRDLSAMELQKQLALSNIHEEGEIQELHRTFMDPQLHDYEREGISRAISQKQQIVRQARWEISNKYDQQINHRKWQAQQQINQLQANRNHSRQNFITTHWN